MPGSSSESEDPATPKPRNYDFKFNFDAVKSFKNVADQTLWMEVKAILDERVHGCFVIIDSI